MIEILHTKHFRIVYTQSGIRVYLYNPSTDLAFQIPASMTDLLDLADKMQDAAVLLRSIVAEADPGPAFEQAQALQFGAHKLEGDI